MATTFLEPGGDAVFDVQNNGGTGQFWDTVSAGVSIATDFVHGKHVKSLKFLHAAGACSVIKRGILASAGSRSSFYIYINAYPSATIPIAAFTDEGSGGFELKLTTAGVLQLARWDTDVQIGSNGPTLSTGVWYRLSFAYTITSTTVNEARVFVDSTLVISATNSTIGGTGSTALYLGLIQADTTGDLRISDVYTDNSTSLLDTGNIWVTAKRPVSNGTTNGFTTQVGTGGSGYGTGHAPQINERPISTTNGWKMVGAGSAVTEEYNIEAKNVGDIDISAATIVDWAGWVSMFSLASETVQIILNGTNVSQAINNANTIYFKFKGSSTYPSGTGADIGVTTDTTLTTVELDECGILVAFIPIYPAAWASQTISQPYVGNDIQMV